MQKTLDILERNVQWIALGLGGIFLLWAVYAYVVTPPAAVDLNHAKVGAGEMSIRTEEGPAKSVQTAMTDNTGIQIPQLNVAQAFHQAMVSPAAPELPAYAFGLTGGAGNGMASPEAPGNTHDVRIAQLPQLPPARVVSVQTGLSVVNPPNNVAAANPVPPRGGVAVQPVIQTQDLDWVGVFFKVPADQLKKAFEAPIAGRQMDPTLYNTTVLQVEVERQQAQGVDANGQPVWPKDDQFETVPTIKIYRQEVRKMPADSAPAGQKFDYADWAEKNPQLVYTPEFYQVTGGAPPPDLNAIYTPPNAAGGNGAAAQGAGGADNAAPENATQPAAPDTTTQPAAPAGASQQGQPAQRPGPSAMANPQAFYLLQDNTRPPVNNYEQTYRRTYGRPRVGRSGRPGFQTPTMPGVNQNFAAGEGKIDPLNLTEDLKIWAYDDTAKPGQTYRYRMVYKLRNPVFGTSNVADPKLSGQLALVSPPSDWSGPVAVSDTTKFWVSTLGNNKANLDVFQWEKGEWKKLAPKESSLSPGDQVPGTDWTVVDVRVGDLAHDRDKYVLLTSDTGQMARRDYSTDRSDPTHQDLVNQTNPNPNGTATPGQSGPVPGSMPPPMRRFNGSRGR